MPTYPFERRRFWIDGNPLILQNKVQGGAGRSPLPKNDLHDWFYIPSWKRVSFIPEERNSDGDIPILVFANELPFSKKLIRRLRQITRKLVLVKIGDGFETEEAGCFTLNPQRIEDYQNLFHSLEGAGNLPQIIIHLWTLTKAEAQTQNGAFDPARIENMTDWGFYSLLYLAQALNETKRPADTDISIKVITNQLQSVTGTEKILPEKALVLGPVKIIPREFSKVQCECIDIEIPPPGGTGAEELISYMLTELVTRSNDLMVAFRGKSRWTPIFEPVKLKRRCRQEEVPICLREKGVYLITGGLGAIGLVMAEMMAKRVRAKLILVGRSGLPAKHDWETWLKEHEETDQQSQKIRKIQEIESLGGEVMALKADITDAEQMKKAVMAAESQFGKINGIFHCAGLADGALIELRNRETTDPILAPKVKGTLVLDQLFYDKDLDFLILYSSINSMIPILGQAGYCAANCFLDAYAHSKNMTSRAYTLSINWDTWREVGMAVAHSATWANANALATVAHSAALDAANALAGLNSSPGADGYAAMLDHGILSVEGMEVMERILDQNLSQSPVLNQVIVSTVPLEERYREAVTFDINSLQRNLQKNPEIQLRYPRPELLTPYMGPCNQTQAKLVEIWQEVLGFDKLGIDDNFFELGGHSLKATVLTSRIHKAFNMELPLHEVFESPTIREQAEYLNQAARKVYVSIQPVTQWPSYPEHCYPVSSAQKRIFILQQLEKNQIMYNIPGAAIFEGGLERSQLESVFQELIRRHESLRTSFETLAGAPVQRIHPEIEFSIEYRSVAEEQITETVKTFIRPFNLSRAPLLRVGWLELSPVKHLLIYDMHHIISDGISLGLIFREFTALCQGQELEPLPIQYKDYAVWQHELFQKPAMKRQKDYWVRCFSDEAPILNFPTDFPRPAAQSFAGGQVRVEAGSDVAGAIDRLAAATGATPFMILLSASNILLSKYSGQEDIVIGCPIAGRPHADLEKIIGMFVNTLALRNHPSREEAFTRFLMKVKENSLAAFANQDYPFEELVETLELRRDLSRNPLFDVMFALQDDGVEEFKNDGFKCSIYNLKSDVSKFDITINALKTNYELKLVIDYCVDLFQTDTIERFANHLLQIINQITINPEIKLGEISLLNLAEKRQILEHFNNSTVLRVAAKTLYEIFEEQAARTPDNRAVIFGEQSLTYRELNHRANLLARWLRKRGIQREQPVGIMVSRSLEMSVGIMAILKAGGAYLPIDPHLPKERITYILADSGAGFLLTVSEFKDKFLFGGELLLIDDPGVFAAESFENLDPNNESTDLAYVIYTSGSTGNPKGAMIEHHSVINRLQWMQKKYPLNETDVILQKTPYTFDVSVWELFWWSWAGATVCFLGPDEEKNPEMIAGAVDQYQVTTLHFVPSMLNAFLEYLEARDGAAKLSTLRRVFVSGEALQSYQVHKFNRLIKRRYQTGLHNLYGPTEATVDVSYYDCPDSGVPAAIPIGKPIDNCHLYVLDQNRQLQPLKIPGELFISGIGVGRGYLNRPELTREKFSDDPFRPGARMYQTGDLARLLPDGNIEYLGRTDFQVKIRGFRIELGEIEAGLQKQPGVKEAAVVAREAANGEKYLCAYVVGEGALEISRIKEQLTRELPPYMIPSHIMQLEQMPLSTNGKLERKRLPEPDSRSGIETEYAAPGNELESQLARIWMELLEIRQVGMNDNFFELGGHSLKANSLVLRILEELKMEVTLKEVFQNQTIRTLASFIANRDKKCYQAILPVGLREHYPVSSAQMRTYVANQHFTAQTSYNMPGVLLLEGNLDRLRLEEAFQALIERHESFRTGFELHDGEPAQIIAQNVIFRMDYSKAGPEFDCKSEKAFAAQEMQKFIQPFDLSRAPLLRVKLLELAPARYLLFYDMSHIISDGVSMEIMIRDLSQLYNGGELAELPIQYKDFTVWQNEFFKTEAFQRQEQYWLERLSGELPSLDLPIDYPRPPIRSYEGDRLSFEIGPDLAADLNKIAVETGATLFMILLAAYNILLLKYTGAEDILIGTNIAGRSHPDLKNIIGMFTNTLVLRNFPKSELSFREFLAEVRDNTLEGYDNQDYPFEKLLGRLNLKRDPSRNPLVETVLSFQDSSGGSVGIPDLQMAPYDFEHKIARMDLLIILTQTATGVHGILEYSTRLFKPARMETLKQNFLEILTQIVQDAEKKLGEFGISSGLLIADTDVSQINSGDFGF
ncbi:MAG TPA: amino acid adenylation domain-containing protein [Bacillota bacterium]|nr:amino acid adenylation domain-containing protein [Bacillota bacterium]